MEIVAGKFPSSAELQRVSTFRKFGMLYAGRHFEVFGLHELIKKQYAAGVKLVYLAHNLPAYISDFYGDFVAGNVEDLIIQAGTGNKEQEDFVAKVVYENDLKERIEDFATEQSEFGVTPIIGWKDEDGTFRIDSVAQDAYFPQSDGSVIFVTYKRIKDSLGVEKVYCLVHHYKLEGKDCVIERSAWICDNDNVVKEKTSIDVFSALFGTRRWPDTERIAGLNDLPIRQIDNGKRGGEGFAKSDYADIMPQLEEINERGTHIATSLLKNLDSKMQLPASMYDEDGNVKNFDAIKVESKDDVEAKYIINSNPLIAEAREHIMQQMKVISTIDAVPMFELLKGTMPDRVESLRMQLFSSVRRAEGKRARIRRALQDMFRIGGTMCGTLIDFDVVIQFGSVLPRDENIDATTEATRITAGISSRRSAIMRTYNVSEDEAQEELDLIREEDKVAGVLPVASPPQIEPTAAV